MVVSVLGDETGPMLLLRVASLGRDDEVKEMGFEQRTLRGTREVGIK